MGSPAQQPRSLAVVLLHAFLPAFTGVLASLLMVPPSLAAGFSLQETYLGEALLDQFGFAVGGVGDLDGDGFAEFVIGANVNDEVVTSGGKAYLFRGAPQLPDSPGLSHAGELERGYLGASVSGGGDLNGDGYLDWAVGASGLGADGTHAGRVYVYLGGPGFDMLPDLVLEGLVPGGQYGSSVLLAGDLDGDGIADLAVGAPRDGAGKVYIYSGSTDFPVLSSPLVLPAPPGDLRFGRSLALFTEWNVDGDSALLVGAPRSSVAATWAGVVRLYAGGAPLDSVPDLLFPGESAGDEFGTALAVSEDLNANGTREILVGAPQFNTVTGLDAGRTYLFEAGASLDTIPDLSFDGAGAAHHFGFAFATGFDFDGDGQDDLAVGAPDAGTVGFEEGACQIYLGGGSLGIDPPLVIAGPDSSAHIGISLGAYRHGVPLDRGALLIGGYNGTKSGRVLLYAESSLVTSNEVIPLRDGRLLPPWPNPFNPRVVLPLQVDREAPWTVEIVDLRGRLVRRLYEGRLPAGEHRFLWNGTDVVGRSVASGSYRAVAYGPQGIRSRPLTLVR